MKYFPLLIIILFLTGCHPQKAKKNTKTSNQYSVQQEVNTSDSGKVKAEVYYFHGTHRCPTCLAVGEVSKAAVENNFKEELEKGIVAYYDINIEEEKNKELAERYQITWNALIIKTNSKEGEHLEDLTDFAFQKARIAPDDLEAAIKARLFQVLNQ